MGKAGRPKGTTRAKGYKASPGRPKGATKTTGYRTAKFTYVRTKKNTDFMTKVGDGLAKFLAPYTYRH